MPRLISIALIGALWLFLRYTRIGNAIRATMQNRNAAQVVGVNVTWVSMLAFGIGLALAGASGSLLSFIFTFYPAKHVAWIGMLMSLVVLGGMGSLMGALVGSFLLAVIAALCQLLLWTHLVADHLLPGPVLDPAVPAAGTVRQEGGGLTWQ